MGLAPELKLSQEEMLWILGRLNNACWDNDQTLKSHEQFLEKMGRKIRRQARATRVSTTISAVAIVYMAMTARVILHQGRRIDSLTNEIVEIKKKQFKSGFPFFRPEDEREGK